MAAAGGNRGQAGRGGGVARALDAAGLLSPWRPPLQQGLRGPALRRGRALGSQVGTESERDEGALPSGLSPLLGSQHSVSPSSSVSAPARGSESKDGTRPWLPVFPPPPSAPCSSSRASAPAFAVAAQDRIQPQPPGSAPSLELAPYWQGAKSTRLAIGYKDCSSKAAGLAPLPAPSELDASLRVPTARRATRERLLSRDR